MLVGRFSAVGPAGNPTEFPPTLIRTYATATSTLATSAGVHQLTYDLFPEDAVLGLWSKHSEDGYEVIVP